MHINALMLIILLHQDRALLSRRARVRRAQRGCRGQRGPQVVGAEAPSKALEIYQVRATL